MKYQLRLTDGKEQMVRTVELPAGSAEQIIKRCRQEKLHGSVYLFPGRKITDF